MKKTAICFALMGSATAAFAVPSVSNVTLTQDAARRICVSYSLSEPAIVSAEFFADGVSIGDEPLRIGLSGDIFTPVGAGDHSFVWRPRKAWPGHTASAFSVQLTPIALAAAPVWMVVDLKNGGTRYYERESQLIGGSHSNAAYKTTHILLKRMRAAGIPWRMGGLLGLASQGRQGGRWQNPHLVTLSEDFYCAVYELTQAQARLFYADLPEQKWSGDLLPAHNLSYEDLRGSSESANWPTDGGEVDDGTLLKSLRDISKQPIDLLTEAQWHFACGDAEEPRRVAGGGWTIGNGQTLMDKLGWTSENSDSSVHDVGGKAATPTGLYDMNGNGGELVLDWCETVMSPESVVDPTGPESQSVASGQATIGKYDGSGTESVGRCYCGGAYNTAWYYAISAYRNWWAATSRSAASAVRLGAPGTVRITE